MQSEEPLTIIYSKDMISLLSMIVDRVIFDSRERDILKDYINAGGDLKKMPEWGMSHELLRQQVKVAIAVLAEQLKDFETLIEENISLKRKIAIAGNLIDNDDAHVADTVKNANENDGVVEDDDILISSIRMSKRLKSGLHSIGIKKLSDLEDHTWMEYKRIQNIGSKSLNELKMLFETYGLMLPGAPMDMRADQIPVDDLPYTRWVKDALKENGIKTLADCANYREDQLYSILGRKNMVKRIKNKLWKYGLSLKLYTFDPITKKIIED